VFPSVQSVRLRGRTGRTAVQYLKGRPGRTGILASIQTTARDGLAGTTGASGGAIFRVTPDDGRALYVPGGPYR